MLYGYLLLAALGSIGLAAVLDGGDGGSGSDGVGSGQNANSDDQAPDDWLGGHLPEDDDLLGGTTNPLIPADTGATAEVDEDGTLVIDVGADETGSLVAVKTTTELMDYNEPEYHGLDFYLLPEGVSVPIDPDGSSFNPHTAGGDWETLDDLMTSLGAQRVASLELGTYTIFSDNDDETSTVENTLADPSVEANVDYDIVQAVGVGDSDTLYLTSIIPAETISPFEPLPVYYFDSLKNTVSEDTTGTDVEDWIFADNTTDQQISIWGLGAADKLESNSDHVSFFGGDGDDRIEATGLYSVVDGGNGNDQITVGGVETVVQGGAGDDTIGMSFDAYSVFDYMKDTGDTNATATIVHGGDGNDMIRSFGETGNGYPLGGLKIYGDAGDDNIITTLRDTVYGGDGNDWIGVAPGVRADGGAGNDLFKIEYGNQLDYDAFKAEGPSIITTGEGADFVSIQLDNFLALDNADKAMEAVKILRIKDFDTSEDVLNVDPFRYIGGISDVAIDVADDQSYTMLTVSMKTSVQGGPQPSYPDLKFKIQLDGVTDFTKDMLNYGYTPYTAS